MHFLFQKQKEPVTFDPIGSHLCETQRSCEPQHQCTKQNAPRAAVAFRSPALREFTFRAKAADALGVVGTELKQRSSSEVP